MSVAVATPAGRSSVTADDNPFFEVVFGKRVEMTPMSFHATKLAFRIAHKIATFLEDHHLGETVTETLFRLPLEVDPFRNRRPDAAFVSYERWPQGSPEPYRDNAWDVVPDLAIEVVSPSDRVNDLMDKLAEYFEVDVRTVWVVHPRQRLVYVYDSLHSARGFGINDTLDGGRVLPGFSLPLKQIFVAETIDDRERVSDE